mgnify:CR=1 FL=1
MIAVVHIWGRFPFWSRILNLLIKSLLFRHPIFSSFGHYCCVIFSAGFFRLAYLALQNVNNNYEISNVLQTFLTFFKRFFVQFAFTSVKIVVVLRRILTLRKHQDFQ